MTDFIVNLIVWGGYFGIFLLMAIENIIPPIPSEVILGLGAIAVARGQMELVPLILAGTIGTVAGNFFWYELGRRVGYLRFRPLVTRYGRWAAVEWQDVERLHGIFQRHGQWIIFVFRFMPAFRTIVSLPAGMAHMHRWKFAVWTAGGSAIWNCVLAGAGYYLGTSFRALDHYVGPASVAVMALIVLLYAWRVLTWKPRDRR
jgi:membrane protein DedA with SNARE-associated domain